MGKMQLTRPIEEKEKIPVAAHFSGLQIIEPTIVVGKEIHLEVTYRTGNQLVRFGELIGQVKGNELDALNKAKADKEKANSTKK